MRLISMRSSSKALRFVHTVHLLISPFADEFLQFFTCGGSNVAQGIKEACIKLIQKGPDMDYERATEAFLRIQKERYATDIFG
jgi:hypothetical protein